jgi:uroporphyrinogen-III decarboxylase
MQNEKERWRSQFDRAKKLLELGIDDIVGFNPPLLLSHEVKVRVRKMLSLSEGTLLIKEYETPKGTLRQVVRQTRDWPHGDDIPMFTDYLAPSSRSIEYLVKSEDDLEALACLFREPNDREIKAFHEESEQVIQFAEKNEVLVESGGSFINYPVWGDYMGLLVGDALAWLIGIKNAMVAAFRNPEFVHRLLDIVLEWDMRYIQLVLEVGGVDMIVHRGWYENGNFWSPRMYQSFFAPRIKKLIDIAHKSGVKFCYVMTEGLMSLLQIFKEMNVDIIYGVDPVQGGADLEKIKRLVKNHICLWGGVNSAVTLTYGNGLEIENAVTEAIRTLAPGGGFILSAIDQIFPETPWENVIKMIHAWRKVSSYPIKL